MRIASSTLYQTRPGLDEQPAGLLAVHVQQQLGTGRRILCRRTTRWVATRALVVAQSSAVNDQYGYVAQEQANSNLADGRQYAQERDHRDPEYPDAGGTGR
ncbi:hypothetical protein ACU4GD_04475 [Cupriavidus basilensis]